MVARTTHSEMLRRLRVCTPGARLLTKYVSLTETPELLVRCTRHKQEYWVNSHSLNCSSPRQCPGCKTENKRAGAVGFRLTHDEVVKRIGAKFPHFQILGAYRSSGVPIKTLCTKHNLRFMLNLNNALYNGYGNCPDCRFENSFFNADGRPRASTMALNWMRYQIRQMGLQYRAIRNSEQGGEVFLEGIGYVDGYHARSNTVFEFHGDDWHGCPRKHKDRDKLFYGISYRDRYLATKAKERKIRKAGYNLVVMWETPWKKLYAKL